MTMDEIVIKVRFNEIDFMNVVHHAVYFNWFDLGREQYFAQRGLTNHDHSKNTLEIGLGDAIILPVTSVKCKYFVPITLQNRIYLKTILKTISNFKISFQHIVKIKNPLVLAAEGTTTVVILNTQTRQPLLISEEVKSMIQCSSPFHSKSDAESPGNAKSLII